MRELAEALDEATPATIDNPRDTLFGRRGIIILGEACRPECSIHGGAPIERKGRSRAVCTACYASAWVGLRPIGDASRSRIT